MLERLRGKKKEQKTVPKTGLLLGAAGLLLFIIGIKRSYRLDSEATARPADEAPPGTPPA